MKRLSSVISMVLAIVIVAAAVGALAYGVIEDPAVVGPLAAAVVAIGVAIFQRRWEKSQELERLHRDEMSPIYEKLIETVKTIDEFAKQPVEAQRAFFRDISTALILHGPSPVVRAWVAWNQLLGVQPFSVPIRAQEKLLLAIREDLGHNNSTLLPGELLRLFINEEDNDEDRRLWQEIRSGG
jgi:hypothetical protein